jgi:hypothetical protein
VIEGVAEEDATNSGLKYLSVFACAQHLLVAEEDAANSGLKLIDYAIPGETHFVAEEDAANSGLNPKSTTGIPQPGGAKRMLH